MRILKERDSDGIFTVANAFSDHYIGRLSGNAVKLYLFIKRQFTDGYDYYASDAAKALRISVEECGSALDELVQSGALAISDGKLLVTADSKLKNAGDKALEDQFRIRLAEGGQDSEFTEVVRSINDEFFNGKMTFTWYELIEKCAKTYGFEPETVYLLFSSCKKVRETASGLHAFYKYVSAVAENWYADKIVTPEDVEKREKRAIIVREYTDFVAKKINFKRPFTEQETAVIRGWLDKGVTKEMLAVLLDDTNRVSAFTISKISGEVEKWVTAGLKTPEDVSGYYKALKSSSGNSGGSKSGKTYQSGQSSARTRSDGERQYGDDFFKQLEGRDSAKKGAGAGKNEEENK